MTLRHAIPAALALILAGAATPAFADRPPSPPERFAIEEALLEQGFTTWGRIEFDDELLSDRGVWEVDDAVGFDGRRYDLKLSPVTLAVIEQDD